MLPLLGSSLHCKRASAYRWYGLNSWFLQKSCLAFDFDEFCFLTFDFSLDHSRDRRLWSNTPTSLAWPDPNSRRGAIDCSISAGARDTL